MITSLDNNKIKEVVKLRQKKYRDKENKFIVETYNLIEEALKEDLLLELFILEREKIDFNIPTNVTINYVTSKVMNKLTDVKNCKYLGIVAKKESKGLIGNKYLLLDNIQDPGNLGTIIRTSLGFNIDTIILSNNTCDLYNEKVVRSTEGAIFKINIERSDLKETISILKNKSIPIYGTDVRNGVDLKKVGHQDSFALIMGNEGNGVSEEIKELVDKNIYISMNNNLESLNVSVATGIILFSLSEK